MRKYVREIELKSIFDRIDQTKISEVEKRQAKASLLQAHRIVELTLWVAGGLKRLANLLIVTPVRRGIAVVSKPAN